MNYGEIFIDTLNKSTESVDCEIYFEKGFTELNGRQKFKTIIEVKNECCLNIAYNESEKQKVSQKQRVTGKICLLNFASELQPGGGVAKCKGTQEDEICRRTNLFKNISKCDNLYYFNILNESQKKERRYLKKN